jgi:hypothetical protein
MTPRDRPGAAAPQDLLRRLVFQGPSLGADPRTRPTATEPGGNPGTEDNASNWKEEWRCDSTIKSH